MFSAVYKTRLADDNKASDGANSLCRGKHIDDSKIMGDRSPKANQKKNSQKQSKSDGANKQKQQAAAAKQAAKLAPKKK